jgi:hypothetical protein
VVVVAAVTLSLKVKEAVLTCVFATSLVVVVAAVTLSLKVKEAVLTCVFATSLVVVVTTTGKPGDYLRKLRLPTTHPSMGFHPRYRCCSLRATNLLVAEESVKAKVAVMTIGLMSHSARPRVLVTLE